jgi:hypothetical protein
MLLSFGVAEVYGAKCIVAGFCGALGINNNKLKQKNYNDIF